MNPNLTINTIGASSGPIRVLRTIQQHGLKSAIIAGGAIRDLYTSNTIKDFDIFLWDPSVAKCPEKTTTFNSYKTIDESFIAEIMGITAAELADPFAAVWIEQEMVGEEFGDDDDSDSYFKNEYLTQVWNVEIGSYDYQLIFLKKNPIDYVENNFDFGICRTYCDGIKMRFTSDFLRDVRNKTITVHNVGYKRAQFEYAIRYHLQRVRVKFPSYSVVVDPSCAHFITDKNRKYLTGPPVSRY